MWSLAPVVERLQALRGVSLIVAVTFMVEVGDIRRFEHPRQLMAYLGLVPSERSTGDNVRRVLAESAWSYRHPARVGKKKYFATRHLPEAVRDGMEGTGASDEALPGVDRTGKAQHGRDHRCSPSAPPRSRSGDLRPAVPACARNGVPNRRLSRSRRKPDPDRTDRRHHAYRRGRGDDRGTPVNALWPASPTPVVREGQPRTNSWMRFRPAHQSLFTNVPGLAPTDMRTSLERQASRGV